MCAHEKSSDNKCNAVEQCDNDGTYTVRYGVPGRTMDKKFAVRVPSRSISPPWRSIRFRLAPRTYAP